MPELRGEYGMLVKEGARGEGSGAGFLSGPSPRYAGERLGEGRAAKNAIRTMKYRDIIAKVEAAGWVLFRQAGSHLVYRHPTLPSVVVIPAGGKMNRDAPKGTENAILRQAGLK
jgi:predicted RNA binding protein YcfA (HicA-like mRNA interferase family)